MGEKPRTRERDFPPLFTLPTRGTQVSNRWNRWSACGVPAQEREATGVQGVPLTDVSPSGGEPGMRGASPPRDGHLGAMRVPRPPRRGDSLTFDFSCPRPGGTRPARSRERRQDARSSRAMAGCGRDSAPRRRGSRTTVRLRGPVRSATFQALSDDQSAAGPESLQPIAGRLAFQGRARFTRFSPSPGSGRR